MALTGRSHKLNCASWREGKNAILVTVML